MKNLTVAIYYGILAIGFFSIIVYQNLDASPSGNIGVLTEVRDDGIQITYNPDGSKIYKANLQDGAQVISDSHAELER